MRLLALVDRRHVTLQLAPRREALGARVAHVVPRLAVHARHVLRQVAPRGKREVALGALVRLQLEVHRRDVLGEARLGGEAAVARGAPERLLATVDDGHVLRQIALTRVALVTYFTLYGVRTAVVVVHTRDVAREVTLGREFFVSKRTAVGLLTTIDTQYVCVQLVLLQEPLRAFCATMRQLIAAVCLDDMGNQILLPFVGFFTRLAL